MAREMTGGKATVSGPGVDKAYPSDGVALSAAITHATRCSVPGTFYVRDADGEVVARVERDERSYLAIYGPLQLAAERAARPAPPAFTLGAHINQGDPTP